MCLTNRNLVFHPVFSGETAPIRSVALAALIQT
jgi:hypothetical protein